ncbi:MAG: GTP-binding protein [Lachnospiraceae bacterium]|nr:GTP-binding protein [Lachnospiraceae bacterium]
MGDTSENKPLKYINVGLLAHVDAGKTTLSEALLYTSGNIRKLGRVDSQDAFLDTYELERARGITIFSKQAVLKLSTIGLTLLDTPGHVDFSAEMERTLQVLDYGILVISGTDGIQGHTRTLWQLLKKYKIPVVLFVNKMDRPETNQQKLMEELREKLDQNCVDFSESDTEEFYENVAMCQEEILDYYLEHGMVLEEQIKELICQRQIFPCFFGSALKLIGIKEFLQGVEKFTKFPEYPEEFAAKIFKITRDGQGNRLTHLKVTGGTLKIKTPLTALQEKVNQIRIYSGEKFEAISEAGAGTICAVTGLQETRPGEGLGIEKNSDMPMLVPVMTCQILLPPECDMTKMIRNLYQLQEEEPELHIIWDEVLQEIRVQVMGQVQLEILKSQIMERFGVEVSFGAGSILYKETIADPVEGVGHYEPLRHYAEVHLLLEPGEPGSGLQFFTSCSEDVLDRNWQRLILTHLEEKEHRGVLTGSPITDLKVTLIAGRAHLKHTEGGDFRQATYRALRQGLMEAQSVLLEPMYAFRLEVPQQMLGRAINDVERMSGRFDQPKMQGEMAVIAGIAPASEMQDYQQEVIEYTRGEGKLSFTLHGYEACHNAQKVIERAGYDPKGDLENSPDSVFCAHGAGFVVDWQQVKEYMHIETPTAVQSLLQGLDKSEADFQMQEITASKGQQEEMESNWQEENWIGEDEVEAILSRTFGANRQEANKQKRGWRRTKTSIKESVPAVSRTWKAPQKKDSYLLVDGYNIIFAWQELKELAALNIDSARGRLLDIMCNYQGLCACNLIVVFDAYRVQRHQEEILDYHNIHVVFTREAETADQYIERFAHEHARQYQVTVATSDGLEQIIIQGQGCRLISARELQEEIQHIGQQMHREYMERQQKGRYFLGESIPDHLRKL